MLRALGTNFHSARIRKKDCNLIEARPQYCYY